MGTSRTVAWALIVSVCCLSSMLAVTALSDTPADLPAPDIAPAVSSDTPSARAAVRVTDAAPRITAGPPAPLAGGKAVSAPRVYYKARPGSYASTTTSLGMASLDPEKTTVSLKGGLVLQGDLVGIEHLKIKTEYGELSIPIKLVGSIHWKGTPEKTTVQMRNGDRLTGRLDETTLNLKAVWGDVSLDTRHVVCVVCGADQTLADVAK